MDHLLFYQEMARDKDTFLVDMGASKGHYEDQRRQGAVSESRRIYGEAHNRNQDPGLCV